MNNIIIENLIVDFELTENDNSNDKKRILDNISLDISEGEFVCILGKNGSGKSTLAKTLNALILPSSGKVTIYGMDTKDESKHIDIRKNVGMAFQNPDNQIVASIVEEDVAFGLENLGVPTEEMRKRIDDAMSRLHILDLKDKLVSKLSGGQKQKVSIAGILAMKSKIIVLDEPTSMIDKASRIDLLEAIKELNEKYGITIIFISHHIEEMFYASRVIVINDGKVMFDEKPQDLLLHADNLMSMGIDLPFVPKFANELRKRGLKYKGNEISINDLI